MMQKWEFSLKYYQDSAAALDTALKSIPAYQSWRDYDPGVLSSVDTRFQAMPALTKKDIREYFPLGFVTPGVNIQKGLDSGEISFVNTSGTTDDKVTNIWNQKWWDASEQGLLEIEFLCRPPCHRGASRSDSGEPAKCRHCFG